MHTVRTYGLCLAVFLGLVQGIKSKNAGERNGLEGETVSLHRPPQARVGLDRCQLIQESLPPPIERINSHTSQPGGRSLAPFLPTFWKQTPPHLPLPYG